MISPLPPPQDDLTPGPLRRFQASQDAYAFREIVERYGGLIEGTARQMLDGDREAAQDVAQKVFVDLAAAAAKLAPGSSLGGWLHRHTVFLASHCRRAEKRRLGREREAASRWEPTQTSDARQAEKAAEVHTALTKLPMVDRQALLLRYWENRSLADVGRSLGVSEDAAQKRVSRALDRLRGLLGKHVPSTLGIGMLGALISHSPSAQAATAGWASAMVKAALDPANQTLAGRGWGLSGSWPAGLGGAGLAALLCAAAFLPVFWKKEQALTETRAQLAALSKQKSSSPALPVQPVLPDLRQANAELEKRIRQLEEKLDAKSYREQLLSANLKRARERAEQDRATLSADELTELESLYQLAKKEPSPEAHAAALAPMIEQFGTSNRAGCAVLRLARLSYGMERERWLSEAISQHSDAYFLDGTSVGAMARLLLAMEYFQNGHLEDATRLRQEIEQFYPDATDHDGLPIMETLRNPRLE